MKIERLISHLTPVHYTNFVHWIVWDIWAYIHDAWCMVYGDRGRKETKQRKQQFKLADAENHTV